MAASKSAARATGPCSSTSTARLAGIEIFAPRPFAKPLAESRPTHVRIEIPGRPYNDVTVESGSARAKLRFATDSGQWRLERGTARFDGQPAALGTQRGLLVTGDWPQFDLAEWLALGDDTGSAPPPGARNQTLMDWLGPVDVHLDRATVFGFELSDVVARLRGEGESWRIGLTGPNAEGQVTVPADLSRGRPIVLDMKRLQLVGVQQDARTSAAPAAATQTDPRKLPALQVRADDFAWEGRRFGRLDAVISRDARGLTFQTLQARSPQSCDRRDGQLADGAGRVADATRGELHQQRVRRSGARPRAIATRSMRKRRWSSPRSGGPAGRRVMRCATSMARCACRCRTGSCATSSPVPDACWGCSA